MSRGKALPLKERKRYRKVHLLKGSRDKISKVSFRLDYVSLSLFRMLFRSMEIYSVGQDRVVTKLIHFVGHW